MILSTKMMMLAISRSLIWLNKKNSNEAEEIEQDQSEQDASADSQNEDERISSDGTDEGNLRPVQYSTRKSAYPFYINEDYL